MIIRCGISGILLLFFVLLSFGVCFGQSNRNKIKCVCIDAGHGGRDPGAVGAISLEKNIVLKIALSLGGMIEKKYPGIKVVYTRDSDVLIDLDKRGKIANDNKADLFISIHINSSESKSPHGIETYVLGMSNSKESMDVAMKENASIKYEKNYSKKYADFDPNKRESYIIFTLMQNIFLEKSLQLAGYVQEELVGDTKKTDRGVRQNGYLVLKDAAMPAILIEACFISNAEEERYLNSQATQNKIATSILKGIERYKNAIEKNSVMAADNEVAPKEEVAGAETSEAVAEVKTGSESELFYAIQIASAGKKIRDTQTLGAFEGIKELVNDDRYRYYVNESADYNEVKGNLSEIKRKIKDCFIIAVHKGRIIPVAEARKLEKK